MKRQLVLNIVGLSSSLLGENCPNITKFLEGESYSTINPVLPAVTCSVQATYLTGKWPEDHGIVGNGWYYKDVSEVALWRQSRHLVQSELLWETAKKADPNFTCAQLFWWFNMYCGADWSVTPRPMYPADGRKLPDIYSNDESLRFELQDKLGPFPLFKFWGPMANFESTAWIDQCWRFIENKHKPTLSLVYWPHLDYSLQKFGPGSKEAAKELKQVDNLFKETLAFATERGISVTVLSEYGIQNVDTPIYINRILREAGLLKIKTEMGREQFDPGASKAFAVCDHQVAHIYVNDKSVLTEVVELLKNCAGIADISVGEERSRMQLNHDRAGDIVAVAKENAWFCYYHFMIDDKAPDYARTVDIHRKPGYDPVELFLDPKKRAIKFKIIRKLVQKKLGFRTLLDVIPLDPTLVQGSHGTSPKSSKYHAILSGQKTPIAANRVKDIILEKVFGSA